jgi:hypothetical protein
VHPEKLKESKEMKELKVGDLVEVSNDNENWYKAKWIKEGHHKSAICVNSVDNERFDRGNDFKVVMWTYYRRIPEVKYIPYTNETLPKDIIGKVVRDKEKPGDAFMITSIQLDRVVIGNVAYLLSKMFDEYEYFDVNNPEAPGVPFGQKIESEEVKSCVSKCVTCKSYEFVDNVNFTCKLHDACNNYDNYEEKEIVS